ncbi:MAG: prolyl-tRNA synthetase associated domain-containing protein [Firmicutes bacterium]|nr:prolyl-tRNA synthetase associated domain-containing protein [Bacillota bacterium]NSW92480.1 prolyl-tRNA synthetase associated domain-containing protein [Bacillota bacterium]
MKKEEKVYDTLDKLDIAYCINEHPAVYTVEEAQGHCSSIPGTHCKNLFLTDTKGRRHYLIVMRNNKKLDIKKLAERIGEKGLKFASERRLKEYLDLTPGSVSPFGVVNDINNEVIVVLDEELKDSKQINFHPNINTITLTLKYEDFERFLEQCGNQVIYLDI